MKVLAWVLRPWQPERYARFTTAMHAVYSTMERELDESTSPANHVVWHRFGDQLRRGAKLQADLEEVGAWPISTITPATERYLEAIVSASRSDAELNGARLLGHVCTLQSLPALFLSSG